MHTMQRNLPGTGRAMERQTMREHINELLRKAISAAQEDGGLPAFDVDEYGAERPNDTAHGEWYSSIAMRSSKQAHIAPHAIADAIVSHLPEDAAVASVEVAGPGFINFHLSPATLTHVYAEAHEQRDDFGKSDGGRNIPVQVEFVSANPVGPMHVGHGRWAALGDSLCNVMEHAGWDVEREFLLNDYGSQMDTFGRSIQTRYEQLCTVIAEQGCSVERAAEVIEADRVAYLDGDEDARFARQFFDKLGKDSYGGGYIIDTAMEFYNEDGNADMDKPDDEVEVDFRERGYASMLKQMEDTLDQGGTSFDVWFSERQLHKPDETGKSAIERSIDRLDQNGYIDRKDGAIWFKSTMFGDDKDRVIVKSDGADTYFAADIAYHYNKFQRGYQRVINIWGADHHGYVSRVKNVCAALGYPGQLDILLGQMVNLMRNGQPVRMSKRKGTMVSYQELLDEVGRDATRYTLISKSSDQVINFDIERAKKQDAENPVYYVQYAHARICSIIRKAASIPEDQAETADLDEVADRLIGSDVDLSLLTDESELELARKLDEFEDVVAAAARDLAPFRLTHYAETLAGDFHSFYTCCHVLDEDSELTRARLLVCDATRTVLALTLKLIGVSAPMKM